MKIDFLPSPHIVERLARLCRHLGPACWVLAIQFFMVQVATALAYKSTYSWGRDPISYLGITQCSVYGGNYVCSPLHALFNFSLIALGVATAAGALFLYHQCHKSPGTLAGFSVIALASIGTVLVGFFPANTLYIIHNLGAGLALTGGLVGMFLLAISLHRLPRQLRYVMAGCSSISLLGLVLLAVAFPLGLGYIGTAERVASYPGVLGVILFGAYRMALKLHELI